MSKRMLIGAALIAGAYYTAPYYDFWKGEAERVQAEWAQAKAETSQALADRVADGMSYVDAVAAGTSEVPAWQETMVYEAAYAQGGQVYQTEQMAENVAGIMDSTLVEGGVTLTPVVSEAATAAAVEDVKGATLQGHLWPVADTSSGRSYMLPEYEIPYAIKFRIAAGMPGADPSTHVDLPNALVLFPEVKALMQKYYPSAYNYSQF